MTYIDGLKKIQAKHYTDTNGRAVRVVVMHDMESSEGLDTAETVARYFSNTTVSASAHICTDTDSSIRCVDDNDVAWAAPGCNSDGLQLEMAGRASQDDAEWKDTYSLGVLKLAAKVVADWCKKYNIPIVHLSNADLAAGKKGIVGHKQVSAVYKRSTHTDPGDGFPWAFFIGLVKDAAAVSNPKPAPTPKPSSGSAKVSVASLQSAVHTTADGKWGSQTDTRLRLVRKGPYGTYNVRALQEACGTTVDNKWGPHSQAAYFATVKRIQAALGQVVDGRWGPKTEKAFWDARVRYYLKF